MLSLFLALSADLGALQDADEKFQRRLTPVVQVCELSSPAVVFIQTAGNKVVGQDFFGRLIAQRFSGSGSGVVVKKQGFIITNYHVVKDAKTITVSFDQQFDTEEYKADLVSFVEQEDLALLKITRDKEFPTIPLGTSSDLMLGETVVAIGNPVGQTNTATQGIISGLHRNVQIPGAGLEFGDLIQTDASINFGNSGGPLLNINGELIGINSAMNVQAQNIGFAIPVDRVKRVLKDRLLSTDAARTWLGFEVESGDHLQVAKVIPGGPAAQAGIKPGDCIVAVNGQPVMSNEEYRLARIALPPDNDVELKIERSGATRRVRLKTWDNTEGILFQRLGIRVQDGAVGRSNMVRVSEVQSEGSADRIGLKSGDVFSGVRVLKNGRWRAFRVRSGDDLAGFLMTEVPAGSEVEIEIYRDLDQNGRFESDELHRGTLTIP